MPFFPELALFSLGDVAAPVSPTLGELTEPRFPPSRPLSRSRSALATTPPTVACARSATPPNDSRVWAGAPARSAWEEGGGGEGGDAALPARRFLAAYSLVAAPPKVTEPTKPAARPLANHPNVRQRTPQPRLQVIVPIAVVPVAVIVVVVVTWK